MNDASGQPNGVSGDRMSDPTRFGPPHRMQSGSRYCPLRSHRPWCVGPTRAADVRSALRLGGAEPHLGGLAVVAQRKAKAVAELQMLVLSFAGLGVGKTMAPIPARVGAES